MYDPNQNPMSPSNQSQSGGQTGQSNDPAAVYNNLNPNQRAQVAQSFIQGLSNSKDPQAQRFASMDPDSVTPDQLTQMHQYSEQNDPQTFMDTMQHPALAGSGLDHSQPVNQPQDSGWDPSQNPGNTGY